MRLFLLGVFTLVSTVSLGRDYQIEPYTNRCELASLHRLQRWVERLPVVATAGTGYVACAWGRRRPFDTFLATAERCWLGNPYSAEGVYVSCARRCGGAAKTYSYYAVSHHSHGFVDYAVFCKCENLVNWYGEPPWPSVLPRDYDRDE